jgi:NAD(P)-dependent dehydrogenase (short-subunit alcohol dehydrogenase family)
MGNEAGSAGTPLAGRVAIITGGGSGIGRGIAIRMAQAGADVVLAGRRPDVLDKVCAEIKALGGLCLAVPTDISQKANVDKLVEKVMAELGKIDILVNCAGIANITPFIEMSDEKRDEVWNTNLKGTWDCCKAVAPVMIKQGYGRIVNISSVTGPMVANMGWAAYAASKGAICGFTRALALDLAAHGITVNAICPGWIKRDTSAKGAVISDHSMKLNASIPLGRVGTPEEVGNLAVFLASEAANYITGTETVIDGGNIIQEKKGDF